MIAVNAKVTPGFERMQELEARLPAIVTEATRAAAYALRNKIRSALREAVAVGSHGLPRHIDQAVIVRAPTGPTAEPRASVVSIATVRRGAGLVDLVDVLAHGASIEAPAGRFLAIPTENAPRLGRRVMTAEEARARLGAELVFIPTPRGAVLVDRPRGARQGVVMYVLRHAEGLSPRFDLDGLVAAAKADLENRLGALMKGAGA